MKKLLSLLLMATIAFSVSAQKIPVNKVFNLDKDRQTLQECVAGSKLTSNVALLKNDTLPVYLSDKGKLFVAILNKKQTGYTKKYLKYDN